jgi:SepF-like predicted cell division protein (DUF552 family)
MGVLDRFKTNEEYLHLDAEEEALPQKFVIEVERIENLADTDRIQKKVRAGSIMLVKIRDLKNRDMSELKRAVDRVKKTVTAINGDIAGIGEDWVVITPGHAEIHRDEEE